MSASAQAPPYTPPHRARARSFDYTFSDDDDDIKQSFLLFSLKVNELEEQLVKFANSCLKLERVAGLLLVIKPTREKLRHTREVFFHNATALVPDLLELAWEDCSSKPRASNSERYYIPSQYFDRPVSFSALPTVLEELGESFLLLHKRINEFREFTDAGSLLKSLLLTLNRDLMYRASCARYYSDRLNTPPIQRYIHQFINELQADFDNVRAALSEFATTGVAAIGHEQARSSSSFANMLTVSTLFSGITASALQMSMGRSDQNNAVLVTNLLWFMSLIFSVGAALNNLTVVGWNERLLSSRGSTPVMLVTSWVMDVSQPIFLEISIATFSAGLIVFAFASNQAVYTPYLAVTSTAVTFFFPLASVLWISYEIFVSPQGVVFNSGHDSDSAHSKSSLVPGSITTGITLAQPFLRHQQTPDDVEKVENLSDHKDSPISEHNVPDRQRMTLQGGVKKIGIFNSALGAFSAAGQKKKRRHNERLQRFKPKPQTEIDSSSATVPLTELILSDEPASNILLARHGTIRDLAYSDDGKWLAVTW